MTDRDQDLFDKIDAILGKRDAEVLADKNSVSDDFPLLMEVIEGKAKDSWHGSDRRGGSQASDGRRLADRRLVQRRLCNMPDAELPAFNEELERLLSAAEHRLTDLFIRQQLRMEEALRKVIRDELGGGTDGKS